MVRAWRFVAVRRAVLNPAISEIYIMFLPSQSWGIVSMLCPWARHRTLQYLNEAKMSTYMVGQRWQCVRYNKFNEPKWLRNGCKTVCSVELKWYTNKQVW